MNVPNDLLYTKSHEWIKFENDTTAMIGMTDYAQSKMGKIVFVNLPEIDECFEVDGAIADVESIKAVGYVYSPVSGAVAEINDELLDTPEKINASPYEAWFVKMTDIDAKSELMDAAAYQAFLEAEENNR